MRNRVDLPDRLDGHQEMARSHRDVSDAEIEEAFAGTRVIHRSNTGEVLRQHERILVPELNLGQLLRLVRAEFLVAAGLQR